MRILVINGGRNKNVKASVDELIQTVGQDNVDVIEYGWEGLEPHPDTSPSENQEELRTILKTNPLHHREYDLLLVSGGHGETILKGDDTFEKISLNSLSKQGVDELLDYFKENQVSFKHILLGSCFSSNYQEEFKSFLQDSSGTILGFTTIGTDNFCTIAEDIAHKKNPNLFKFISHGFETMIARLQMNQIAGQGLTTLQNKILHEYQSIGEFLELSEQLNNLKNSLKLEYPHHIGKLIEKINEEKLAIDKLPLTSIEADSIKNALDNSLHFLIQIVTEFTSIPIVSNEFRNEKDKVEGDQIELVIKRLRKSSSLEAQNAIQNLDQKAEIFNNSELLITLKTLLDKLSAIFEEQETNLLVSYLNAHQEEILQSEDKSLLGGIETSLTLYHQNTTYVRTKTPISLPADVIGARSFQEIQEQLTLISLEIDNLEKQGNPIIEIDSLTLAQLYQDAIPSTLGFKKEFDNFELEELSQAIEEMEKITETPILETPDISSQDNLANKEEMPRGPGRLGMFGEGTRAEKTVVDAVVKTPNIQVDR